MPWRNPELREAARCTSAARSRRSRVRGAPSAAARSPERPFVLVAQQTNFDPSRAPGGQHDGLGVLPRPQRLDGDMTERDHRAGRAVRPRIPRAGPRPPRDAARPRWRPQRERRRRRHQRRRSRTSASCSPARSPTRPVFDAGSRRYTCARRRRRRGRRPRHVRHTSPRSRPCAIALAAGLTRPFRNAAARGYAGEVTVTGLSRAPRRSDHAAARDRDRHRTATRTDPGPGLDRSRGRGPRRARARATRRRPRRPAPTARSSSRTRSRSSTTCCSCSRSRSCSSAAASTRWCR